MGKKSKQSSRPTVGERDIVSSTPPTWRLPFFSAIALCLVIAACYIGWIEIHFRAVLAEENPLYHPKIYWGDDFDLFANMKRFFLSLRGEILVTMVFVTMVLMFIIHGIVWLFFRAFMNPELYNSLSERDAWFLGQK